MSEITKPALRWLFYFFNAIGVLRHPFGARAGPIFSGGEFFRSAFPGSSQTVAETAKQQKQTATLPSQQRFGDCCMASQQLQGARPLPLAMCHAGNRICTAGTEFLSALAYSGKYPLSLALCGAGSVLGMRVLRIAVLHSLASKGKYPLTLALCGERVASLKTPLTPGHHPGLIKPG